jgi:hypothetical protein
MGARVWAPVVAVIVIALIVAFVAVYYRRRQGKEAALKHGWASKGDLNARQEQELINQVASADALFRKLLAPSSDLDDMTILTRDHRTQVEMWIANQRKGTRNS